MAEKEIVMNGAGIGEIGFPMWPQFAPETLEDVLEPLKSGKVSYWTGKKVIIFCSSGRCHPRVCRRYRRPFS